MSLLKTLRPGFIAREFIAMFCTCFTVLIVSSHYGLFSENSIEHDLFLSAWIATGHQIMNICRYRKNQRAMKCRENDHESGPA
ncbi:hypothetical protein [Kushneria marisflavi]|uniref:Uncharacterized protein n=1 Tax=Kushneria marisflavi TaxID=157779 RepID=A0A240UQI6_9GAMM|nr:hypothetical protein [Kushneria marisflavi]ART63343.1 hypothetical protein B9H00_09945 [Kushneria marisflavi]RKD84384.1 hypothetical protein C8D96_2442 [Kushneria marisflavi]